MIIPGDPERELEVIRKRDGIDLLDPVVADLQALASRVSIGFKIE